MLSAEARSRLAVVLVGARNPQNIGAAARAMQDFGFSDLRVVNEFGAPFEAAQLEATSAVGAGEVMRAAQRFASLPEAIADCTIVIGTTAIGGRELRQSVLPLRDVAPDIVSALELSNAPASLPIERTGGTALEFQYPERITLTRSSGRVALLFGSEKTGLTNEQLSHCQLLLTIPLFAPNGRHLSLNLGQAVAVCLYELSRSGFEGVRALPASSIEPATSADRERLTALLRDVMLTSDYARRFPANARIEVVRKLAEKLGESHEQAATWMGLFKLMLQGIRAAGRAPGEP